MWTMYTHNTLNLYLQTTCTSLFYHDMRILNTLSSTPLMCELVDDPITTMEESFVFVWDICIDKHHQRKPTYAN